MSSMHPAIPVFPRSAPVRRVLRRHAGSQYPTAPLACLRHIHFGGDPTTNRPGDGNVLDQSSSSPTVLPDGDHGIL
jgi:hypothetical protein